MPKITAAVLAAVLLLTLTGCASAPETGAGEAVVSGESAAPLVAETPAEVSVDDAEVKFLEQVREKLPAATIIPGATDEQLLAAGTEACERRAAGESSDDITLIDGEERNEGGIFLDSQAIVGVAWTTLCPTS